MRIPEVLTHKPAIGLIALTLAFLGQWFRHAAFPIAEEVFGDWLYWVLPVVGTLGIVLVWLGLKRPEIPATWLGFLGGLLIWIGWFEFTFQFFGDFYQVPPYYATPRLVSPPDLNLIQASLPLLVVLFLLFGLFNRETKCNLMRWIHRNFRINPGMPVSHDHQRSYARITALETLFIIWFCYAIWLYITYFGASMRIIMGAYALWAVWCVYLAYKLVQIPRPGYALRYGIAVGIIAWVLAATPSHMGFFPPVWLQPLAYPLTSVAVLLVFIAGGFVVLRWPGRPAPH